jgi:predicted ATPase/class 3 adenylate cyclase/Tfp pilus assembly protein PilF
MVREVLVSEHQSGIVTFLFTDIEGSTRLWESDPRAMADALRRHDSLLNSSIDAAGGTVFKTAGDAFCAVFPTASAAIEAAVSAQRALAGDAPCGSIPIKVRMAIHAGDAERRAGDYFGPPLNRVARLLATAHGRQVLVSRAATELATNHLPPDVELHDLGEHTLKDLQQAERVYQVSAPGLAEDFPPLRTVRLLLRNVPQPGTPLVGREREVAFARALFGLSLTGEERQMLGTEPPEPARLLTLSGPGGAGKTRLASHLATQIGVEFGDGVVFVPLAELTSPALVPGEILGILDLGEKTGDAPLALIKEHLRDRHLLLVLDNFEQVMDAAELVAELLISAPRLHVLVTSRERLNLRGEHELPLPPLALPELPRLAPTENSETQALLAVEAIERSDAVRLFVQRAQSIQPGFAITVDNARAVAAICSRLDGLPLAIELAAARLRLLSPQALLERFDHRLDVLSRGPRDLPARQKTMRDTIAWSYELLDPAEQRLFARLSIFAGGAAVEAVEAVAGDVEDEDGRDTVELLESLADKSLLNLPTDVDEPRVVMLQTIRDYGQEQLAASGEQERVGQCHADFFLALAEESEPQLAGRGQKHWLDCLDRELGNLRAAIGWFRDHDHAAEALRLSGALWRYWWIRGDMSEGRGYLESLLQKSGDITPALRAKALNGAGVLAESQGDFETAQRLHQESLDIARRADDLLGVSWSLNNLGVVAINQGDYDRARTLLEENLAVAERTNDAASVATAIIDLGQLAIYQGEHDQAATLLTRALALFRDLGDESHMARSLNNLGYLALGLREYDRAREHLTESLALHRSVGDRQGIASTLNNLAEVANALSDSETATGLYLESYMLALEGGNRLYAAIAMENLATLAQQRGEDRTAQNRFREALLLYRGARDLQGIAACLAGLATSASREDRPREAAVLLGAVDQLCCVEGQEQFTPPNLEEATQGLRRTLGDASFDTAWQSGRSMPIDEIIDQIAERGSAVQLRPAS